MSSSLASIVIDVTSVAELFCPSMLREIAPTVVSNVLPVVVEIVPVVPSNGVTTGAVHSLSRRLSLSAVLNIACVFLW